MVIISISIPKATILLKKDIFVMSPFLFINLGHVLIAFEAIKNKMDILY